MQIQKWSNDNSFEYLVIVQRPCDSPSSLVPLLVHVGVSFISGYLSETFPPGAAAAAAVAAAAARLSTWASLSPKFRYRTSYHVDRQTDGTSGRACLSFPSSSVTGSAVGGNSPLLASFVSAHSEDGEELCSCGEFGDLGSHILVTATVGRALNMGPSGLGDLELCRFLQFFTLTPISKHFHHSLVSGAARAVNLLRRDGVHGAGRLEVGSDPGSVIEGGGAADGLRAAAEGGRAEEAHGREPGTGAREAEAQGERK